MQTKQSQLRALAQQWLDVPADAPLRVVRFKRSRALGGRRFVEIEALTESGPDARIFFRHDDGHWSIQPQKADKAVVIEKLMAKPIKRRGKVIQPVENDREFNAEVIKNKSIRLYGWTRGTKCGYDVDQSGRNPVTREFERVFRMGDEAEYDSYNTAFIGKIAAIGEKTVTIESGSGSHIEKHRLDLHSFARRNWDFDAAFARKRNAESLD
ncbi:hypothetical protein G3A40_36060 [Paraburkholderia aspalathi]|uniref:hypothetical protein n=1 Tax=Paraburkholderia aspalathi TaxID=1324617 RepID=UPI00190B278C|nr:hypothetical protein [Paraburkholderia aspalathi]MBK3865172.1 hypothetical protein [Paraburkholderia aspalathi]